MDNTTVEEKAGLLIAKFAAYTLSYRNEFAAKQCALICVDEIIKVIPMYTGNLNPYWLYWQSVRTAIENH